MIKPTTAFMLCDMMRDVVTSGTGTACNFDSSMAIAGKTGTTSNYNDYSFVGFTPYYTCTVMAVLIMSAIPRFTTRAWAATV